MLFATEWTTQQTQPHQPQRPQLFILRFCASKYANQISDLHEAQKRVIANVPKQDWAHRQAEKIAPPSFHWS